MMSAQPSMMRDDARTVGRYRHDRATISDCTAAFSPVAPDLFEMCKLNVIKLGDQRLLTVDVHNQVFVEPVEMSP